MSNAESPDYQPYMHGAFRWRLAIRPLDLHDWIQVGDDYDHEIDGKTRVLRDHRDTVVSLRDDVVADSAEVLDTLVEHLVRRFPSMFALDGDDIVTSGFDIAKTVRYRNVRENPRATLVIDDLASTDPWSPRGVKIIGSCTVESHGQGERFRIHPEVIISWGVNDTTPGIPTMERREVG